MLVAVWASRREDVVRGGNSFGCKQPGLERISAFGNTGHLKQCEYLFFF